MVQLKIQVVQLKELISYIRPLGKFETNKNTF